MKKEGLNRLQIESEIDLVTWQYDLAKWLGNGTFWEACPPQAPLLKVLTV